MLIIYVDADACSVKREAIRVATRHNLQVYLVSNNRLNMAIDENVRKIQVGSESDAADNWIAEHIGVGDIAITVDILLADRCLKKGAHAINQNGKIFDNDNIGIAKAMRDLRTQLREAGIAQSYNASFTQQDRSQFLQTLEETIQQIKRQS